MSLRAAIAEHRDQRESNGSGSLVVRGGTVITMDPNRRIFTGDLHIEGGRFVALGNGGRVAASHHESRPSTHTATAGEHENHGVVTDRERSRSSWIPPTRVLDARGCAVLPGLVQAHVHLCQTLFRGMADGRPLLSWLRERIWPLEAAHDEASATVSAELGLAEMIRGGTTTILDMGTVHCQDAIFSAMARAGIRGASGKAMMDRGRGLPAKLRERTTESLRESEALLHRWRGAEQGRLGYALAPRFILSCSERLLRGVAELSATHDVLMHTHAAEHREERDAVRSALGCDDVAALASFGIEGERAVLAHGVQLRKSEMKRLARAGTRIVHCPSANLKLGSGIADVVTMRAAGIVVGLGADGAPCNNRMDAFTEMRTAALLAKALHRDATALPAADALALATIEGARVLGLDDRIGSIEVGKRADLIVVRLDALEATPTADVVSALVYGCGARDVRHVVIDGFPRVVEGELGGIDLDSLRAKARRHARRTRLRAGLI